MVLPEEIQENIIVRLPVKSILRFKTVCKRWYKLFCSPEFIKDHLSLAAVRNKNPSIIDIYGNGNVIYSVDYDVISSSSSLSLRPHECNLLVQMDYPLDEGDEVEILGSCNGLICLKSGRSRMWRILLLNPATNEYKRIMPQARCCAFMKITNYLYNATYGFGFDRNTHDYKLVRIVNSKVFVYSLKSDSWRTGQTSIYPFTGKLVPGLLHNGALHWLGYATNGDADVIVSFDISNERFINLPLLEETMWRQKVNNLGVLGDALYLVYGGIQIDVWVMQNYGMRESWTKLFTTTKIPFTAGCTCLKPIWSFQNGDILIETNTSFFLYDQKKDRVRYLKFWGSDVYMPKSESYLGSLVSLNSGKFFGQKNDKHV